METTYSIYRGWADGESMKPHLMQGGIATLNAALELTRFGGYVVRDADGASLMPNVNGGQSWIDESGEEITQ